MVVGGYWTVLVVFEILRVRGVVEMCVGKNAVALRVGRALT